MICSQFRNLQSSNLLNWQYLLSIFRYTNKNTSSECKEFADMKRMKHSNFRYSEG